MELISIILPQQLTPLEKEKIMREYDDLKKIMDTPDIEDILAKELDDLEITENIALYPNLNKIYTKYFGISDALLELKYKASIGSLVIDGIDDPLGKCKNPVKHGVEGLTLAILNLFDLNRSYLKDIEIILDREFILKEDRYFDWLNNDISYFEMYNRKFMVISAWCGDEDAYGGYKFISHLKKLSFHHFIEKACFKNQPNTQTFLEDLNELQNRKDTCS